MGLTASRPLILVVGATGQMGRKIVRELCGQGRGRVRALHRPSSSTESVEILRELGAELVVGDLDDEVSLVAACRGARVVVSAVAGLRGVIVDGQARLLRAAASVGVARMIASDYALDFFRTEPGGNRNLDLRRELAGLVDASPVRGTSVLCGTFMDLFAYGALGPDRRSGAFRVWGDLDQASDFTLSDDVARYVAHVALDDDAPRVVRVAGDTRSPRDIAAIFEDLLGMRVKLESAGSLETLGALIERLRAEDPDSTSPFPTWQRLQYARDMQSGRGRFEDLDGARYPAVEPIDMRSFLAEAFEGPVSDRRPIREPGAPRG
jgi:uncharacterized protein YbjT (DUF2867 family)